MEKAFITLASMLPELYYSTTYKYRTDPGSIFVKIPLSW